MHTHSSTSTQQNLVNTSNTTSQHELVGNRLLGARLVDVLHAMSRAFPLLLGSDVDAAVAQCPDHISDQEKAWIVLGITSGQLVTLIQKLPSQPQVAAAYKPTAAIRNKATVACVVAAVLPLKV